MIGTNMLHFSDAAETNLLEADEKLNLVDFLAEPRYRVGDIPFTYRQIYLMSRDGLLDAQEDEGKWRLFSFTELVFLLVAKELKKMGFPNRQLVPLYKAFFKGKKNEMARRADGGTEPRGYAPKAVAYVFGKIAVTMRYTADGDVDFYDPVRLPLFGMGGRAFVLISINDIVDQLLTLAGSKERFDDTAFRVFVDVFLSREEVTDKERQLLEVLRDEKYESVHVQNKNKEISVLHPKQTGGGDVTPMEVLRTIEKRDFQNITIQTRGGKVTHFSVEDVLKL